MSSKKHKKLGRGLEALLAGTGRPEFLSNPNPVASTNANGDKAHSAIGAVSNELKDSPLTLAALETSFPPVFKTSDAYTLLEVPLAYLHAGKYQPRREIHQAELESLAESIRSQGILQPIVVRSEKNGQYEILAGERRFRAAKLLDLPKVPVIVKDVEDTAAMAIALIENIQRENLSPLEEATALDRLAREFDLTHAEVAETVGKSRSAITNLLRLLTLTEEVKELLEQGAIEVGHAKALLALRGYQQSVVARNIAAKKLSVRETERLISRMVDETYQTPRRTRVDPDVRQLQDSLSEKLGAAVQIVQGSQGKGKLVIQYNTLEELDGILEHIK